MITKSMTSTPKANNILALRYMSLSGGITFKYIAAGKIKQASDPSINKPRRLDIDHERVIYYYLPPIPPVTLRINANPSPEANPAA